MTRITTAKTANTIVTADQAETTASPVGRLMLGQALNQMRAAAPLVHNITNYVAMNMMANVLLAAGASPAMVHAKPEAAEFAQIANAVTINIGTLSPDWVESMLTTAQAATDADKIWVLDPVAAGATAYRRQVAADLLAIKPSIIRGNASEIMALAGADSLGKGADTAETVDNAASSADALAKQTSGVVAVSGAIDYITDGSRRVHIANGHPLMPRITVMGCSLNGIIAAFAASHDDPFTATVAAMVYFGVTGELAGEQAKGPGSFAVAFLDALMAVDADTVMNRAQLCSPSSPKR